MSRPLLSRMIVPVLLSVLLSSAASAQTPALPLAAPGAPARNTVGFVQVATFDHQPTGVAVSEAGRVFVNFPRWSEDAPVSVGEVMSDGTVVPYPDVEWNGWRNAGPVGPSDHFVCVQAVYADGRGSLWVVDPGAPNAEHIVPGAPKLVKIDLATNKVARVYGFDKSVAPDGSYLNDVRISPDGAKAYMTDSGGMGALVVVDLRSGQARRVLDSDRTVQADTSLVVQQDGTELRRPDGRAVMFAADSIALDPTGDQLYWKPLTGSELYRISTAALFDTSVSPSALAAKIETVAILEPTDGIWMDPQGRLFLTAPQDHGVKAWTPAGGVTTIVSDSRLRWPDTFAQGPDGTLYVTDSDIPDTPWFKPKGARMTFGLWKLDPAMIAKAVPR